MRETSALCVVVAVAAALGVAACGGDNSGPTSPGGGGTADSLQVRALDVSCPTPLLIGQRGPCVAVARLGSGAMPLVSFDAAWSSASPDVVTVDAMGVVKGQSAGQAIVSASYGGRQNSATLVVTAEDGLRVQAGAVQGAFTPGSTVTMWLQGYYGVNSATTGRLSMQISDQARTITRTAPLTVAKGGDFFILSSTFVVPEDSVEVCRSAILEIGPVSIVEPQANRAWTCEPIRR
jgi:hypothetical protein